jgi:hypothetical protein
MGRTYGTHVTENKRIQVVLGMSEGKRLRGSTRDSWVDNINIYFKEISWEVVKCVHVA